MKWLNFVGGVKMSQEVYELSRGLDRIKIKIEELKRKICRPLIVGIAGGSGSGKTTKVARRIQNMFPESQVLSMDDYFQGWQFMQRINSNNWDEPRAIDLKLLVEHLKNLKQGLTVQKPIYSFRSAEREGYEGFDSSCIVILEGLYALHETVVDEVDLRVFVEISIHGSLLRRLIRDVGRTGQSGEDIFRQYVETVYPMYKLHIKPTKSRADIIIINQYLPQIETESCETREIQIKVALKQQVSQKQLEELGFKKVANVFQEDTYYVAPTWQAPYSDELMRIRKENGKYFLAYKGPISGGLLRIKPKIEFEVEPSLRDALEKLGYKKVLSLYKRRERLLGAGVELVIDRIEKDGNFLEFRTPDPQGESQIMEYLKKLGISRRTITKKSYLELMLDLNK